MLAAGEPARAAKALLHGSAARIASSAARIPSPDANPEPRFLIAIIDYQMGNLRSVQKGFEKVGHAATITSDPAVISRADKVVLPGVGAFGDAMAELTRRDLVRPIQDVVASGKPFLGICLGLQLLFDVGYEHGEHRGLGI